ncbi:hypothetical protein Acor_23430 [Acrocarpospora corrugata]|uniref:CTP synthase (glutamine hydrolyzing) n=1 Tax=Acrocarpospora corrugata TaxID=35763 RepID=A0A5M3VWF0_9ACTN|nr:hypothetical protein [Acrocarpospora corrugata]GES00280.1 hypothetical protein Acor_23430 [Acrocarpospora corrugata]
MTSQTARIALVGDRSPDVLAHTRIPAILDALRDKDGVTLDAHWVPTPEARELDGFDGVWMLPGSPYRSEEGALAAARWARTARVPLLGTCGGFQHAVMEFAQGVCGLVARHAETAPDAAEVVIQALACSLAGQEGRVHLAPGSRVASIMGEGPATVRYNCSYGINPGHRATLEEHGLRFTGHDDQGEIRVAEINDHPFFLITLFQPELSEELPHPVIRAFAAAATTRER